MICNDYFVYMVRLLFFIHVTQPEKINDLKHDWVVVTRDLSRYGNGMKISIRIVRVIKTIRCLSTYMLTIMKYVLIVYQLVHWN